MANSSYDDKELVKRLQAGDLQALNHLIDRYMGIQNVPSPQDTAAEYETAELQQQIARAVARLKPDQRALVSLYYLQGFSCAEISEILQKPLGTVKTHLFRARNNLKKMLAGLQLDQEI